MKKLYALSLLASSTFGASAQLTVTDSLSLSQIAMLLEGLNVSVSNVSTTCHMHAAGEFSGLSEIPFQHGIILSTGDVNAASGANTMSGMGGNAWMLPGDEDMDSLAQAITYDACVLEFDCVPAGDTLLFNFAFASEEYPEFVGGFNDVFAILLSGPGIDGRLNAATLPGGVTVSINNVNATTNAEYYYDNLDPAGQYVTYDGFTTGLTAFAEVQPGGTYHFKVAIADAMDQVFDSAVLLEAFSFRSVTLNTSVANIDAPGARVTRMGDQFFLDLPADAIGEHLTIVAMSGSLVQRLRIADTRTNIDLAGLSAGVYAIHFPGTERAPLRFVKD